MDRRVVRAWCLYDFGNSAFAMLFPALYGIFYAGTVVGDADGRGDAWWGATVSAGMLVSALTAPFLGGVSDHAGVRKKMLAVFTGLGVATVLCFSLLGPGDVVAGFLLGALAMFGFEAAIVFYNSYLPRIAPASHHGRVSAYGFAVGYVGSLIALAVAVTLITLNAPFGWVWVALAVQWLIGAVPAFRRLPADPPGGLPLREAARRGVKGTWTTLREVLRMPSLRWFLLAFFVYMDGVETVVVFASRYATKTLGFSRTEALGMLALVQITALAGSLALAKATDVRGPRFVIRLTLLWWTLVVIAASQATTKPVFWVVAGCAGLGLGAVQSSSRALMARLVVPGREAEMFGFMALCGRTGSIIGPLVFGLVASATGDQRPAVLSVIPFFAIGLLFISRVREPVAAPEPPIAVEPRP
jgi:MFS transporter, UMF1 family